MMSSSQLVCPACLKDVDFQTRLFEKNVQTRSQQKTKQAVFFKNHVTIFSIKADYVTSNDINDKLWWCVAAWVML